MLLDRTLDVAILYEPPRLPELSCVPIGELTLKLYSSRKRESLKSALEGNYVYLDWGGSFARFHQRRCLSLGLSPARVNRAGSEIFCGCEGVKNGGEHVPPPFMA